MARRLRRGAAPYASVTDLFQRAQVPAPALERLAEADALACLGLERRQALWAVRGLAKPLPLFDGPPAEPPVALAPMTEDGAVVEDYHSTGLSLRRHPVAFLRADLQTRGMTTCAALARARDGRPLCVAGLVLVRQRPGSAKGVTFLTIEDETGTANLIVWPSVFERQRRVVLTVGMIACHGSVQREGSVIHVVTHWLEDLSALLRQVGQDGREIEVPTRDFR